MANALPGRQVIPSTPGIDRALFRQSAMAVAQALLGLYLVHETRVI